MKAVVIARHGGVDGLEWIEVPDPEPGRGELKVRVRCTALNRADLLQRRGLYPPPGPTQPFEIPGLEFAGEVAGIGPGVPRFPVGGRVMGITSAGAHAEFLTVPAALAMPVPEHMDWREAAALPEAFVTAHDALVSRCGLSRGESVLIHAAGSGVGTAAVQIARSRGAHPILGTAGRADKLERAAELGLDVGIHYPSRDFAEAVEEAAPGGVNVILDLVGAPYWERNLRALAVCGRMVIVGLLGGARIEGNLATLLGKRLTLHGTVLRSRTTEEKALAVRAFADWGLPLLESRQLRPVIDSVFPLRDVRAAHLHMEGSANFGKIVLEAGHP